jgi:ABC-type amino acid transport substrate-binding protein
MKTDLSGAVWRKSARSGGRENCVEVAGGLGSAVGVRDSKNPADPALIFTPRQWDAFVDAVKNGRFDR